jgi:hypothetical protein
VGWFLLDSGSNPAQISKNSHVHNLSKTNSTRLEFTKAQIYNTIARGFAWAHLQGPEINKNILLALLLKATVRAFQHRGLEKICSTVILVISPEIFPLPGVS